MAPIIGLSFTGGLISRVDVSRQVGKVLFFTARGTAPGKHRIKYERQDPDEAVAAVLTDLATLSPKQSPRGDEAIAILRDAGLPIPDRDEDPPDPDPADTATDMKVARE